MGSLFGSHKPLPVEVEEGVEPLIDHQNHVPAATAIAAIRAAARYKLLPPEGNAAVASVPCSDCDAYGVDEHLKHSPTATQRRQNAQLEMSLW